MVERCRASGRWDLGGLIGAWWARRSSKSAEIGSLLDAQLEALLDPPEQAWVVSKVQDEIHRRMIKLVTEADPGP